jgi:hypothetical protein
MSIFRRRHQCIQSADYPGWCRRCAEPIPGNTPFYPGQTERAAWQRYQEITRDEHGNWRRPRRPPP